MTDIPTTLADRFGRAISSLFDVGDNVAGAFLRPSTNEKFGDYQLNVAMSLAKSLNQNPRQIAEQITQAADVDDLCEKMEIAGPGFINVTLKADAISQQLDHIASDDRLGVRSSEHPDTVVVDYSSPNVAKQMHVGHLRSTVIGDCICRVLNFAGHKVNRQNHIGDWGTQFGMLIEYLDGAEQADGQQIGDLEAVYREAKKHFDAAPDFAERARLRVVALQANDLETREIWQRIVDQSKSHFKATYSRLGVLLADTDIRGESFYNDRLPQLVELFGSAGLLVESHGAQCIFPEGFYDRDDKPLPLIIRKSDGGFPYAATDLAALWFRIQELHADRIVYLVDTRQKQHFEMVFTALRSHPQWVKADVRLEHVMFGTVLGPDRKPFKTREGGTVKLDKLLEEAEHRAAEVIDQKNPQLSVAERTEIAHAVGIGALKYADLSSDRIKDYVFDWQRMLALNGNTAPYLQNAYVRIRSIFRKAASQDGHVGAVVQISHPAERALGIKILQLPAVIESVADSLEPHRLCTYLYDLASLFHQFYEKCPVLGCNDESLQASRLVLCDIVARTLKRGLNLLGIDVVERM